MRELGRSYYADVYQKYRRQEAFFPVIGAVLLGTQKGLVYGDRAESPTRFYVEHSYGFAQIFGDVEEGFDLALEDYLADRKAFRPPKIRLWTPCEPRFLRSSRYDGCRSERQHFKSEISGALGVSIDPSGDASVRPLQASEFEVVEAEFKLNLGERFWPSVEAFLKFAHAVVAWRDGQPAAICYAAAIADSQAEIDVMTAPNFRRSGLGRAVVECFNQRCALEGVLPVWDCFTNNDGSMALCKAVGFTASCKPYAFYTFARQ